MGMEDLNMKMVINFLVVIKKAKLKFIIHHLFFFRKKDRVFIFINLEQSIQAAIKMDKSFDYFCIILLRERETEYLINKIKKKHSLDLMKTI